MCSSGSKTKTSTSSTSALPQYANAYSQILNQAQGVASTPWNPATGQQVAGFTNPQNQAFGLTQSNLGAYQPNLTAAGSNAAYGSTPISASAIQNYMDPYTQNVVDATMAQFANQNAQQLQDVNANAAKIGALTGDRSQVARSITQNQQNLAQNPIIAGLYSQGYTQALGAAQNDANRALQGAQIQGGLAGLAQQYGQNDVNSLWGIGQAQQTQQQNVLNANTANAQAQAQYPFATTQWLASLATGLGGAAGSNSSQTQPGPNMWSQLAGLGLGAMSLFNTGGRVHYDTGGTVIPYGDAPSYVPASGAMHGGMNHQGPMPTIDEQTGGGMADVLSNFKQAKSAFQGLGNLGSKAWNSANTTTDPTSGWSTTVSPSGLGGLGNYIGNMFGYADGGFVRRGYDGGGEVTDLFDDGTGTFAPSGFMNLGAGLRPFARTGTFAPSGFMNLGAGLRPFAHNDDAPVAPVREPAVIASETSPWATSVEAAPSPPEPMHLVAPEPAMAAAAPSGQDVARYNLPESKGLFGLQLSDPVRQGLLAAGLGMMASESPFVGTAIGQGGLAGIRQYGDTKQQLIENTQSKQRVDLEAQRLAQQAKEATERMRIAALQEGRAAELFPLQQAQLQQNMEIQNRPDIKIIGQDDFGRSIYGLVDPRTGRPTATVDQDGRLVPSASSAPGATGTDVSAPQANGASGNPPIRARMTDLVDGIMTGKQPPTLTGLYKNAGPVRAALAQRGFDLSTAQLQWDGAHKQVMSMNGPQQVRYYQLANGVVNTIDRVNELSRELKNSGVPLLNKAKLDAYIQLNGNSPQGQLATQYVTAVGVLREEMANLANGGYAPTEPAWALANEQVNGNYGVLQLGASLTELQRLINYRLRALPQANTLGPGAANPYTGATGKQPTHEEIDKAVKASQPEPHPSQAADGAPSLVRPKTKTEYDALPSGSRYIDPEGKERTKP